MKIAFKAVLLKTIVAGPEREITADEQGYTSGDEVGPQCLIADIERNRTFVIVASK